jgi:hypothetical protein
MWKTVVVVAARHLPTRHRHAVVVFLRRVDDHAALTDETYRQGIVMPSSSSFEGSTITQR